MPVRVLQRRMTAPEFAEYLALDAVEPWDLGSVEAGVALIAQIMVNAGRPRGSARIALRDLLGRWWREGIVNPVAAVRERRQTAAQMQQVLFAFARQHGAKEVRPDGDHR